MYLVGALFLYYSDATYFDLFQHYNVVTMHVCDTFTFKAMLNIWSFVFTVKSCKNVMFSSRNARGRFIALVIT